MDIRGSRKGDPDLTLGGNEWSKDDVACLEPDQQDPGYFLIVQGWAGVPVEVIPARIGLNIEGLLQSFDDPRASKCGTTAATPRLHPRDIAAYWM